MGFWRLISNRIFGRNARICYINEPWPAEIMIFAVCSWCKNKYYFWGAQINQWSLWNLTGQHLLYCAFIFGSWHRFDVCSSHSWSAFRFSLQKTVSLSFPCSHLPQIIYAITAIWRFEYPNSINCTFTSVENSEDNCLRCKIFFWGSSEMLHFELGFASHCFCNSKHRDIQFSRESLFYGWRNLSSWEIGEYLNCKDPDDAVIISIPMGN